MRKILISTLILILISGCSEYSTAPNTKPFALNLLVTDTTGTKLPGVEARLHVEIPGFNPGLNKSVSAVRFGVESDCEMVMNIFDMEGRNVKTLGPANAMAGQHTWALNMDQEGDSLNGTGLFRYEMVASDSTGVLFRDEKIMTQYDSFDFDQRPVLGVTDAQGRITYLDKTRFPFLYELGPQPGRDENSQPIGEFDFSETVAFTLIDTLTNETVVVEAVVNQGENLILLSWNEALLVKSKEFNSSASNEILKRENPLQATGWLLEQNYPNPFN